MRTQIARWGNSLAVRLPRDVVSAAGLRDGETVELDVRDGVIRLVPTRPVYTLDELLARITPESLPTDIFDDGPRGQELL
jgi:antitoxin MazE